MLNSTDGDDENFLYDDLKQENEILRSELSALYAQFLSPKYDTILVNNTEKAIQTEFDVFGALEDLKRQLKSSQSDLAHEKSHNAEQAKLSKEADRKIRELERKLLDMNLELLQTAPLKDKLEETLRSNETLQNKLSGASNEHINLTVEVKHCKDRISTLNAQIEAQQLQLDDHIRQLHVAETAALGKYTQWTRRAFNSAIWNLCLVFLALKKTIEQKDAQIIAAASLNGEYQTKLQKDDIQFLKLNGELNHWERKCESQSKEIQRLSESHRAITAKLDATVQELRDLETRTRTTSDTTPLAVTMVEQPLQVTFFVHYIYIFGWFFSHSILCHKF